MGHWLDKVIALLQADTANLRELARIAGSDPKTFYRGIQIDDLDLDGQNIEGMEFGSPSVEGRLELFAGVDKNGSVSVAIDDLIGAIKNVGRQEERLVLLLRLILENRNFGGWIIETYGSDKAKYARYALAELRKTLEHESAQMPLFETIPTKRLSEDVLANIIQYPFSRGMPSNRAAMLHYMAMHLADYPKINDFLRSRLQSTSSIFLDPHRKEIQKFLDDPTKISWFDFIKMQAFPRASMIAIDTIEFNDGNRRRILLGEPRPKSSKT